MKMETKNAREVVMAYIDALDGQDFDLASSFIDENVKIIGPAGEGFGKPKNFTDMLKRYSGKYDIKREFVDGNEVCLLYDYHTSGNVVYMCSWYKVRNGKIEFIRTVFDPAAFTE